VPPQIMTWDRRHLEGNVPPATSSRRPKAWVPQMKRGRRRDRHRAVPFRHRRRQTDMMENASLPLAGVDGIDAVLTGHQHLVFPGDFDGIAGVDNGGQGHDHGQAGRHGGFWGSHMGLIDLMLERDGNTWKRRLTCPRRGRSTSATRTARSPRWSKACRGRGRGRGGARGDARLCPHAGRQDLAPLHSYFALVADDPSVQIVSQAQTWYVAEMMKGTENEGLPVLSAAAPFKAGGRGGPEYYTDVPAGDIAIKNVADLYLYPNTVRAVRITGAQVKEWLERSAGMFNQIDARQGRPGPDQPDFPSYNFDVIDGVTYQIDLSQPAKYTNEGEIVNPTPAGSST
jgi:2',3'-cyclic-nucleotide 2'-phosphodiesterase/3'-nucleotidase